MTKIGQFTFVCEACGKMENHESNLGATFPFGWYFRQLDTFGRLVKDGGRSYLLCIDCGDRNHYRDGISDHLREQFRKRRIFFKKNPCIGKHKQLKKRGGSLRKTR